MERRQKRGAARRGSVAVIVGVSAVTLTLAMALAIDIGFGRLEVAELEGLTDASALAGASALPVENLVRERVISVAVANDVFDGRIELSSGDIQVGTWEEETQTFDPVGPDELGNAVRVRARTRIPALFSRIAGFQNFTVPGETIAFAEPIDIWCGIAADGNAAFTGNSLVDGYCALEGPYGGENVTDSAVACSNAHLSVTGSGFVDGSVFGKSYYVQKEGAVSGITGPLHWPYDMPPVPDWVYEVRSGNNDNDLIGGKTNQAFNTSGTCDLVLPSGNYWFRNLRINGTCSMIAQPDSGPVNIFVDGDVWMAGQGLINTSGTPNNLKIFVDGDVVLRGTSDFHGVVMTNDDMDIRGTADYYGAFIAYDEISHSGNGGIHIDECLNEVPVTQYLSPTPKLVR